MEKISDQEAHISWAWLFSEWPAFVERLTEFEQELGLETHSLEVDHCALRVNQTNTAERLLESFAPFGSIISNKPVNGRPIALLKLSTELVYQQRRIGCIELPFPSNKRYPNAGWEHIEMVASSSDSSMNALSASCQTLVTRYVPNASKIGQQIQVKHSSPQAEGEQLPNPSIAFKKNGVCIKLHPHSIIDVINSEQ
ncbi:VOC family protein [Paraferrimonas haliotis]|uniref:VOC family protein n=1 Tax=Paraferrimonas haliotis TaxID=2013866 RepID=A0AA37WYY9_9GAMM|nr:VOC family protein [Paraferrimonas haliotis]GLS84350.1 VOC family protein [Paraferrimonas haliotis]